MANFTPKTGIGQTRPMKLLGLLVALFVSRVSSAVPPYLEGGAMGVYGTKIIVAGGRSWSDDLVNATVNNAIWEFETLNNTWTRVASSSVGDTAVDPESYTIRSAVVGDKMYLVTANSKGNSFYEYSMSARKLNQLSFPALITPGLVHFTTIATTDTFYVVGGRKIGTNVDQPTCFRAEIAAKTWSPCGNMTLGLNRLSGASNSALQYMLVYGGFSSDNGRLGSWLFSRKTDVALSVGWTFTESVGLPSLEDACVVGFGNGFLVYGGRAASTFTDNRNDIYFGNLHQINMNSNPISASTVYNGTLLNGDRWGRTPMCAVIGNVLYAIGRPLSNVSPLYQERIVGVNLTAPDGLLRLDARNATSPDNSNPVLSTGAIAGIGAGAGVLAIGLVVGTFLIVRHRRSSKSHKNHLQLNSDPLPPPPFTNVSQMDNPAGWPFPPLSAPPVQTNFDPNAMSMYPTPLSSSGTTPNQSMNLNSRNPRGVILERS